MTPPAGGYAPVRACPFSRAFEPVIITSMNVLAVIGPTASGKTRFVLRLHEREESVRFVLCDSRKVYRGLNIGTAKPKAEARHLFSLFDIREPDQPYNAHEYARDAERAIRELLEEGRTPVVVGGTPLYFRALFEGFFESPKIRPEIRNALREEIQEKGSEALHRELRFVDPEAAQAVHPNDAYRISRALEVYRQFGVPITRMRREGNVEPRFRPVYLGLNRPREELYERINARFDRMMEAGLLEESRHLMERGYPEDLPALDTLGYREMLAHLGGELDLEEALRLAKKRTRVFSRRQTYYFNTFPDVHWVHPESPEALDLAVTLLARTREKGSD
jgi:tRNA dimethylallyltransferase